MALEIVDFRCAQCGLVHRCSWNLEQKFLCPSCGHLIYEPAGITIEKKESMLPWKIVAGLLVLLVSIISAVGSQKFLFWFSLCGIALVISILIGYPMWINRNRKDK